MSYNYIVDPVTNKKYAISSKTGVEVLQNFMKGGAASSPATTDSGYGLVAIAQEISKRENQVRSLKTKQKSVAPKSDESGSLRKEIRRVQIEVKQLKTVQANEKRRIAYETAGAEEYDYSNLTIDERLEVDQKILNLWAKIQADALARTAAAAAGTPWAADDARRAVGRRQRMQLQDLERPRNIHRNHYLGQHKLMELRAREAQTHAARASDIVKETSLVVSLATLDQEFGGNIEIYQNVHDARTSRILARLDNLILAVRQSVRAEDAFSQLSPPFFPEMSSDAAAG